MVTDSEIETFIRSFEDGSFPRAEWTHGKHLVMALWYLLRYPGEEATRRIREGIQRYNQTQGNQTGYHETMTLAWIAVIERFLAGRDRELPLSELSRELLRECGDRNHLSRFYSKELLQSDLARRAWVPPDLRSLNDA